MKKIQILKKRTLIKRENVPSLLSRSVFFSFFFSFCFFYVYLFLRGRERDSMSRGGAKREGDTESEAGSRLRAVSTEPDAGLELLNPEIMPSAEVGRPTD